MKIINNKTKLLNVLMVVVLLFSMLFSMSNSKIVFAKEITPTISNLKQESVGDTYKISFDYSLNGVAAANGDTFTINLPEGLETANLIAFDVIQNGVIVGKAQPSGSKLVVTFNDKVTGTTNGKGSMAFNVRINKTLTEAEKFTAEIKVGNESIIITKEGTGPIPFESVINKYNQTGTHVSKDFKLGADKSYYWVNTGKDYLSQWHIQFNGDAKKTDLSNIVVSDKMSGKVVTDYSNITFSGGLGGAKPDPSSLFNGPYVVDSFAIVRNGVVIASGYDVTKHIKWTTNGFTLALSDVDSSFSTPSQDKIVVSYMTLIPFGTAEIYNTATYTSDQVSEKTSDTGYWKNTTGEAIYDADDEVIEVSGTKTWDDNNNQDGKRPDKITVNLLADGEKVQSKEVSATDNWSYSFNNLPKNKDGKEIKYTVTEEAVDNYTSEIKGYNITNKYTPETIQVSGTKTWEDNNNQAGKRPEKIKVNLLADGTEVQSKEVSEKDGWKYTFKDLPKNKDGKEIKYTLTEDKVDGYETEIKGYNITNKYTPETIQVSGTKTWDDNNNQDGVRPETITIYLFKNNKKIDEKVVTGSPTESEWKYTFGNLPKYENGQEIKYTIKEKGMPYYDEKVEGYNVTNTHKTFKYTAKVYKYWNDENNKYEDRPKTIKVHLFAENEIVETIELSEETGWKGSFGEHPKFKNGERIRYRVEEEEIARYKPRIVTEHSAELDYDDDGYEITIFDEDQPFYITNTYTPEFTKVEGTKTWDDNNNQDGKRPEKITVNLLADGVKVDSKEVSKEDGWKYTFENLPKYKERKEIEYTIKEDEVEGYTSKVDGYNLTNKHTPETTQVSGTKTWDDNNNQDGKRPEKITVNLLADGVKVDSKEVSGKDGWKYTFENLPKYRDGKEIKYTITEDKVTGYETIIDGYNITNKYTPEKPSIDNDPDPEHPKGEEKSDKKLSNTGDETNPTTYVGLTGLLASLALAYRKRKK